MKLEMKFQKHFYSLGLKNYGTEMRKYKYVLIHGAGSYNKRLLLEGTSYNSLRERT